ncbi:unnamed protein product [Calicophoron daubneyi]|uniref:non-specific serine/threonine protein kinase n=1 Tax=Calicophoron daubneyi TaxID=300641 RepID=A0AAV2TCE1_CALDB
MKFKLRPLSERIEELTSLYTSSSPLIDKSSVSVEYLLDTIVCLCYECKLPQHKSERNCAKFYNAVKKYVERIESCWISRDEFETIRLIGSGAFGEVSVVRWKDNGKIYALKSLHKYDMLKRSDRACFQEERDVMVKAMVQNSPWIAKLHHTFQDEKFLYFLMDFYNGGDMLTMLSKFDDRIPENIARFYITEIILAIDCLHQLGYLHRDIKPDNVLLESSGHIVLADFGSCLKLGDNGLVKNNTAVGTPDYISPEILRATEDDHGTYGVECDFWSLGVVIYEMLYGETPFYSENLIETYSRIMNFEEHFSIPTEYTDVSKDAQDLMRRLICDRKHRLGRNGLTDFKEHPFFEGMDWDNIRQHNPPYIPEVKSPEDTSNFDIEPFTRNHEGPPLGPIFRGCQVACIGFTFTNGSPLNELGQRCTESAINQNVPSKVSVTNVTTSTSFIASSGELPRSEAALVETSMPAARSAESESGTIPCSASEKDLIQQLRQRCEEYESRINDLQKSVSTELKKNGTVSNNPVEVGINTSIASDDDVSGRHRSSIAALMKEMNQMEVRYKQLETQNQKDLRTIESLRAELAEQQEHTRKLTSELRDFEEENEALCKRAADAQLAIRQLDAEHESLLSDLTHLRAELAIYRQYGGPPKDGICAVDSTSSESATTTLSAIPMRNELKLFSDLPNPVDGTRTNGELELQEQLEEAQTLLRVTSERLTCSKQEVQSLKAVRQAEQLEWTRERELIEQQLENALLERASALKELASIRASYSELEGNIANWENRLYELNQWADDERIAKDKLHAFTVRVVTELEGLRAASLGQESIMMSNQDSVYYENQPLWNGQNNVTAENTSAGLDSPVASVIGDGTTDWRKRKSSKMNKMELSNLQLMLKNESNAREKAENSLQEKELKLKELNDQIKFKDSKIEEQERSLVELRSQLLLVSNEARQLRMNTGILDRSVCFPQSLSVGLSDTTAGTTDLQSSPVHPTSRPDSIHSSTPAQRAVCQDNSSPAESSQHFVSRHKFTLMTFTEPTKCHVCTGLMLGQRWQGVQCQDCSFHCHQGCRRSAPPACPPPPGFGRNATIGFGTTFDGYVQMPKAGGIKRGWTRYFLVLSDMRLFFFSVTSDANNQTANSGINGSFGSLSTSASMFSWSRITNSNGSFGNMSSSFTSNSPYRVVDLRSPGFSVSKVTATDVIHAHSRDIPKILKVTVDNRLSVAPLFLLFDSPSLSESWLKTISEAAMLTQSSSLTGSPFKALQLREVCDPATLHFKQLLCACVLDENRILVGTDEGLHIVDIKNKTIERRGDRKPVYQLEVLSEKLQLVVIIQEKQRRLKLLLLGTIEGMNIDPIRVAEPKPCSQFVCGMSHSNTVCLLCAAGRRSVWIYEIARVKGRHRSLRDIVCPDTVQALSMVRGGDWLCIGCPSYFALYNIWEEGPPQALLRTDLVDLDPSLTFFQQTSYEAYMGIQIDEEDYLLVFENCGVYVNTHRQRIRADNLMWPAKLVSDHPFAFSWPHLYVFTEIGLVVYNVITGIWVDTLSCQHVHPLSLDAHLCIVQSITSSSVLTSPSNSKKSTTSGDANSPGIGTPSNSDRQPVPSATQQTERLVYLLPYSEDGSNLSNNTNFKQTPSASGSRNLDLPESSSLDICTRVKKPRRFTFYPREVDNSSSTDTNVVINGDQPGSAILRNSRSQSGRRHSYFYAQNAPSGGSTNTLNRLTALVSGPSDFRHVGHLGPHTPGALLDLGPAPGEPLSSEAERVARFKSVIEEKYRAGGVGGLESALRTPPISNFVGASSHVPPSTQETSTDSSLPHTKLPSQQPPQPSAKFSPNRQPNTLDSSVENRRN